MLSTSSLPRKLFRAKVPTYVYVISVGFLLLWNLYLKGSISAVHAEISTAAVVPVKSGLNVEVVRSGDYELIKPILYADAKSEDPALQPVKSQMEAAISDCLGAGKVKTASVYLKKMNDPGFIAINPAATFNPGSMMKVPVMIAYLKEAMSDESILNKTILFPGPNPALPVEEGSATTMKTGKYYTVRELIDLMIINSDNDAMGLLVSDFPQEKLFKIYKDLHIPCPNPGDASFILSPSLYSRFFRILYNSTYLDAKHSELALSILCKTHYNKSVTRTLPPSIKVAHKYGVAVSRDFKTLSESAIVYAADIPYLLVVMTNGDDYDKQSDLISEISSIAYKGLN